jgi:hypothetical protein
MAEMTQFRQEMSASEKATTSYLEEISTALETTLAQEKEKTEQERNKLTSEIVALITTMLQGQESRWSSTFEKVREDLSASQNRVQGGYQMIAKGLDNWANRENAFSKKLLGSKDDVKKSIVEASKVWMVEM